MSGGKHTPGPWVYSFESVDPEWAVVTTVGGAVIANVNADHRQEANARLIAAAPDLLAALKLLESAARILPPNIDPDSPLAQARAAIAKAEGGAA